MRTALKTTVALVLALSATVLGSSAASAAGEDDVTWTVRTASNDYGDNRTSYAYDIKPGSTIKDALVVANRGKEPLELAVYAADGFTTESGQMDLVTAGAESVGVGAWVQANRDTVQIKPGKTARIPFTATVPENATPGDHAGGIITSLAQPESTETITVDRRLGIQIKLRVDGELKPGFAIEDLDVDYQGTLNPAGKGDAEVSYTVRNTGNAILTGEGTTSITGPFGWFPSEGEPQSTPKQLLPGESWSVTETVPDVAPGVRLKATTKLVPVITDAAGLTTALTPVEASANVWAMPWTLLAAALVLFLAIGLAISQRRRGRARQKAREDARVEEAVKEALQTR